MQSSLKLSCYRQSITLISIVIPTYWNGDFSKIAGFQSSTIQLRYCLAHFTTLNIYFTTLMLQLIIDSMLAI